jgi:hypothetical protein
MYIAEVKAISMVDQRRDNLTSKRPKITIQTMEMNNLSPHFTYSI